MTTTYLCLCADTAIDYTLEATCPEEAAYLALAEHMADEGEPPEGTLLVEVYATTDDPAEDFPLETYHVDLDDRAIYRWTMDGVSRAYARGPAARAEEVRGEANRQLAAYIKRKADVEALAVADFDLQFTVQRSETP